ncbi:M16 family metallopeptidase [Pleomorphovibrio marinus]|uniref:M16 family metallopeptidase n=1 Tax=Pleomorphovibrio marinus TaxID=2164132 RepID=UPI000E0B254B|nr:pitrilysin family protein [Pleomorphovibrio marinus]
MIDFQAFTLDNGLEVLVHEDEGTEMAVFNMLYKVGSKNETPDKTGLAHYFEHLMFGGSKNVSDFDRVVEKAGGECNAFTNTDITNYYIQLPAINLETAFWVESDRMLALNLKDSTIETQREVVIEEFKQRYLNQPYGDIMHHVRDLAFTTHPYRWPTIGKEIAHIENFNSQDIREFFHSYYGPNNAILVVAGKVKTAEIEKLASKWFGDIPARPIPTPFATVEPPQLVKRSKKIYADVPSDALYKVFHIPGRLMPGYLECDLITDLLSFGRSAPLEQKLVKGTDVFATCQGYVMGNVDPNLLVISAKMERGREAEEAEELLNKLLLDFKCQEVPQHAIEKVKHQAEAMKAYESLHLLNRAMKLAYFAQLGNPNYYWEESDKKLGISRDAIQTSANRYLDENNASTVYYKAASALDKTSTNQYQA